MVFQLPVSVPISTFPLSSGTARASLSCRGPFRFFVEVKRMAVGGCHRFADFIEFAYSLPSGCYPEFDGCYPEFDDHFPDLDRYGLEQRLVVD